jgi:hypothetical protein
MTDDGQIKNAEIGKTESGNTFRPCEFLSDCRNDYAN